MITADYNPDNGLIRIDTGLSTGKDWILIDLDEAVELVDRLRQILDEHPQE